MITVQNEDRQAGPGRGVGRWPGMYRGAWTRPLGFATVFLRRTPSSWIRNLLWIFCLKKVDTEETFGWKTTICLSIMCSVGGDDVGGGRWWISEH